MSPRTKAMGRMAAITAKVARMVGLPTSSTASTTTFARLLRTFAGNGRGLCPRPLRGSEGGPAPDLGPALAVVGVQGRWALPASGAGVRGGRRARQGGRSPRIGIIQMHVA